MGWFQSHGVRAAVLKHSHKLNLGDEAGKDTLLYRQAGARLVALSAPGGVQITRYRSGDPPLEEILDALAPEADLILVEGYKIGTLPKILLVGNQLETVLKDFSQVIALVSADPLDSDLPVFHPRQVSEIGGFLRKYLGGELGRKPD